MCYALPLEFTKNISNPNARKDPPGKWQTRLKTRLKTPRNKIDKEMNHKHHRTNQAITALQIGRSHLLVAARYTRCQFPFGRLERSTGAFLLNWTSLPSLSLLPCQWTQQDSKCRDKKKEMILHSTWLILMRPQLRDPLQLLVAALQMALLHAPAERSMDGESNQKAKRR